MRPVIREPAMGLLSAGIATDVWLGETKCAEHLRRQVRQPAALLLVVAEEHDRLASDRLMRADEHRRRSAVAPDALQHAVVAGDAQPAAAVLARDRHPQHAQIKKFLDDPLRNLFG